MNPTVGSAALPAGTNVALASGEPRPIEELTPGAVLEDGGVVTSVMELPHGAVAEAVVLAADALAPGSPAAPLVLSPLQWIAFGDRLAPAGALANGGSIRRLPTVPPSWYALAADRPATLLAGGVRLALPGPAGLDARFRPLAAGPELAALRAGLRPPPPTPLRVMLGAEELPTVFAADDRLETSLPGAEGAPMTVLRLVSPAGRPRGTQDLRRFGVAIRKIELDGTALTLDDPGFGDGFYPVERRDTAAWRWTDGEATLALPPAEMPRALIIHLAPWHARLEPA